MSHQDKSLREHLLHLLQGGGAHLNFEQAISGVPESLRGAKLPGSTHTPWRLLEHLRICQWDILEFSRNPAHTSPAWPDGYWPDSDAPTSSEQWEKSVEQFRSNLQAMSDLVSDPSTDLFAVIPHGDGQTILREALLIADHNAYHLGQLAMLTQCLKVSGDR